MCVATRRFRVLIFLASEQLLDLVESGLIWDANSSSSSLRSSSGENTVGAVHKHTKHFWCCRCRGVSLLLDPRSRRAPKGKCFSMKKITGCCSGEPWGDTHLLPVFVPTPKLITGYQQQIWGTFSLIWLVYMLMVTCQVMQVNWKKHVWWRWDGSD